MKTKFTFLTVFTSLLVLSSSLFGQKPDFAWAKHMVGTDYAQSKSIKSDDKGNVYTTGVFAMTVDFDPGKDTLYLTSAGDKDIFIQKLDSDGKLLWVKQIGGAYLDEAYSLAVDASGNVYTAGYFSSTVDFDPGSGSSILTNERSSYSAFITKHDTNGNFLWVKKMGGTGISAINSIAIDARGGILTTGSFRKTVDFDPGAVTNNLTSEGNYDIFILKLDAYGNLLWVKQIGDSLISTGTAISTDASGNVYATGYFYATADFDPGAKVQNLTPAGKNDSFILKLDPNGNFVWVKQISSTEKNVTTSIATDLSNNVYTTGYFEGTAKFSTGAGATSLTSAGSNDIFIQKLDTHGNLQWAKQMGGAASDVGHGITTDAAGNVYTTGMFANTVDFNPGGDTAILTSAIGTNIFIQKHDTHGNFAWVSQIVTSALSRGLAIAVHDENIYTTGFFAGTAEFDAGDDTLSIASGGINDIFIYKMGPTIVGISANTLSDNMLVYPNPASSKIQIRNENAKGEFRIYNILGKMVLSEILTDPNQTIDIQSLKPGIYIWQTENRKGKLMVQ